MRKFLIVAFLGVVLLTLTGCDRFRGAIDNYDSADSAQVAEFVNSISNPQLMSVEEILTLKQSMLEKQGIDSAFLSLDDDLMETVSTVLLKRNKSVTKKDIVEEYRRCMDVYDNLPKDKSHNKVDLKATDLGNRRDTTFPASSSNSGTNDIISTSYSFRTDTVNGKPVRIRIQKIESYE